MNKFYLGLGVIVYIIISLNGFHNKEKRLLMSILLFLLGSLPWIIYGLIEIGMRSSSDWSIIIFGAICIGGGVSLSASFALWAQEKGYDVWHRFLEIFFRGKNKHK